MSAGKKVLIVVIVLVVISLIIWLATRGEPASPTLSPSTQQTENMLKGDLVIKGSDTLLPLSQAWAEEFMNKNPEVSISLTGGGSGVGIAALLDGSCDIANASRSLKPPEMDRAKKLGIDIFETKVAIDGIALIVNPQNPLKSLDLQQLKDIYTGHHKSWKELGGPDIKLTAIGRDTPSGTYELFKERVLGKEDYAPSVLSTPSNNQIATTVAQDIGAIGYVGIAYAEEFAKEGKVKILAVAKDKDSSPFLPTAENIKSKQYPLYRYLYNYTRGKPTGIAKSYLYFVTSSEGQKIVEKVGYIPLH